MGAGALLHHGEDGGPGPQHSHRLQPRGQPPGLHLLGHYHGHRRRRHLLLLLLLLRCLRHGLQDGAGRRGGGRHGTLRRRRSSGRAVLPALQPAHALRVVHGHHVHGAGLPSPNEQRGVQAPAGAQGQRGVQGEARPQQRGRAQEPRQGQGEAEDDGEPGEGADGPEREPDEEGGDADQGADGAEGTLRQRRRHAARRLLQAHGAVLTRPGGAAGCAADVVVTRTEVNCSDTLRVYVCVRVRACLHVLCMWAWVGHCGCPPF